MKAITLFLLMISLFISVTGTALYLEIINNLDQVASIGIPNFLGILLGIIIISAIIATYTAFYIVSQGKPYDVIKDIFTW